MKPCLRNMPASSSRVIRSSSATTIVEPCTEAGTDPDEDGFSLSDTMLKRLLESLGSGDSPAEKRPLAWYSWADWISPESRREIEANPGVETAAPDPVAHETRNRQTAAWMPIAEAAPRRQQRPTREVVIDRS